MNVVLLKFNHFGDNIVFVPVVQALRARLPDWRITVLTTPAEAGLYGGPFAPHELLLCPKASFDKSYRRPWMLARWIFRVRRLRPDACLVAFDQGTAAHLVARLSGARVRVGGNLGHIRVRGSLTHELPLPPRMRPAEWNWEMLKVLVRSAGPAAELPEAPPPPDFEYLVEHGREAGSRPRVVVHAGSSRPLNRWPAERFAEVAARLSGECDVAWVDREETASVVLQPSVRRVEPVGLRGLASLLSGADLFLGNNSGPMHLANALGCRGVVVAGPTAFGWDPYWNRDRWTTLRHPTLPCAPCEQPNKMLTGCALASDPLACLRHWTADAVEAACRQRLGAPRT